MRSVCLSQRSLHLTPNCPKFVLSAFWCTTANDLPSFCSGLSFLTWEVQADCHGNMAKFKETVTWNEDKKQHREWLPKPGMCNSGPQILAMTVRCSALSVNVIPSSGIVVAIFYWARDSQVLRAQGATGFHYNHMRWISTCNSKWTQLKSHDQVADFLTICEFVTQMIAYTSGSLAHEACHNLHMSKGCHFNQEVIIPSQRPVGKN